MTIRSVLMSCATLAMATAAFAADQAPPQLYRPAPAPVQPVAEWTGLYFGVNAGYGAAQDQSSVSFTGASFGTTNSNGPTELSGARLSGTGTLKGPIAGGQIGFNWQTGAFVFGGEVDGQWSGQRSTFAVNCNLISCAPSETATIRSIVTARGRVGYAFDSVLAYVTGGAAFINFQDTLSMSIAGVGVGFPSMSTTAFGWTAGAGVEVNVWGNWSAKLEYLHIGVNNVVAASAAIPSGFGTANESAGFQDNILRVGLNYRFGPRGGAPPLLARSMYSLADALPAYTSAIGAQPAYTSNGNGAQPAYTSNGAHNAETAGVTRPAPAQNVQQVANTAPSGPSGSGPDVRPAVMDPAYANLDTDGLSPLPGAAGGETANTDYVEHKPAKRSAYKDSDLKRVMEICRGC